MEYFEPFKLEASDGLYIIDYYSVDFEAHAGIQESLTVILVSLDVSSYLTNDKLDLVTFFDVIFAKDKSGGYRLVTTNPGQIFYNIEVINDWPIAIEVLTISFSLPKEFILKGAMPIHIFLDGIEVTELCIINGTLVTVLNVSVGSVVNVIVQHSVFAALPDKDRWVVPMQGADVVNSIINELVAFVDVLQSRPVAA